MNVIGLLGATVARIVISMLWFSPMLFWPAWSRYTGLSEAKMKAGMGKGMAVYVIGSFLMAFVLLHAIFYAGARTIPLALGVSFVNWLGFVAVAQVTTVTDEKRPFGLFVINSGFQLVSMLVMGPILTTWGLNW